VLLYFPGLTQQSVAAVRFEAQGRIGVQNAVSFIWLATPAVWPPARPRAAPDGRLLCVRRLPHRYPLRRHFLGFCELRLRHLPSISVAPCRGFIDSQISAISRLLCPLSGQLFDRRHRRTKIGLGHRAGGFKIWGR
jgi:hypothetical protein